MKKSLEDISLPPDTFHTGHRGIYSGHAAYHAVLKDALQVLGVSAYRLSRLLGCEDPLVIYKWLNGRHRPSQGYVLRLTRLLTWELQGLPVHKMDRINWVSGHIMMSETNGMGGDQD